MFCQNPWMLSCSERSLHSPLQMLSLVVGAVGLRHINLYSTVSYKKQKRSNRMDADRNAALINVWEETKQSRTAGGVQYSRKTNLIHYSFPMTLRSLWESLWLTWTFTFVPFLTPFSPLPYAFCFSSGQTHVCLSRSTLRALSHFFSSEKLWLPFYHPISIYLCLSFPLAFNCTGKTITW